MTAHKNNKLNIINWSWGCHGKICYDIVHCAVTRAFYEKWWSEYRLWLYGFIVAKNSSVKQSMVTFMK